MPKPVKKPARLLKTRRKRPSDPNRAAEAILAKHVARTQGQPAANQPILDPGTVIREHMAKLGAKGGKISGSKRMENLSDMQRRDIAMKAAKARWGKKRTNQS